MIEFSYPTGRTALRTANPGAVLDRNEGLLEVAQETAHVADDEHVEGASLRRGDHRFPGRRAPCRGPAGGSNGPLEGRCPRDRTGRWRGPAVRVGHPGRSCPTVRRSTRGTSAPPAFRRPGRAIGVENASCCRPLAGQVGQHLTSAAPLFNIAKRRDEGEDDEVDRSGSGPSATGGPQVGQSGAVHAGVSC